MNQSDLMRFASTRQPSTDFAAARSRIQTLPLYIEVALDVARSLTNGTTQDVNDVSGKALLLPLNANFIYTDQKANSGFITLHFQDDTRSGNTPITFYPGMIVKFPFTQAILENTAQSGQTMRLIYGVDLDFAPAGLFGTVTIAGTVNTQEQGYQYGAAYGSSAVLAANAASQVFAPASNVSGAIIHQLTGYSSSAAAPGLVALTKTGAAPAGALDGDVIQGAFTLTAGSAVTMQMLTGPIKIAAGKGLWFLSTVLETAALRSCLYTLL
jgi:hypothetical protein